MGNDIKKPKVVNAALCFAVLYPIFFICGHLTSWGFFGVLTVLCAVICLILSIISLVMHRKHQIKSERNKAIVSLIICVPFVLGCLCFAVAAVILFFNPIDFYPW